MKALYELLAKVGTNPKLRAWAMEQLINLKKLKPNYKKDPTGKKSWEYKMDLDKVKDIKTPNWRNEKIAKEKAYDLKTKVVDITKARDKVRWNKVDKQHDKDKFYGVTGQVDTFLKKMNKEHLAWEAKIAKDDAWFNKLMKAKVKGDPRAIKILDDYFKKMDKDFADKIIPFKPKKAEGGRIGLDEGGPSQKDIDKGIAAIEKLKSSLMPESYEELIEIYKDKQKDLNIDIMEDAGGLGEMLGEGGRIGMMYGGDPGFAFSYGGSWADWKDNHASEMPLMDYINQKLPKARNPFSNGGEVPLSWEEIFTKHMQGQPLTDEERKILGQVPTEDKAEGGRIGMAKGDTPSESWMRDYYFDGKGNYDTWMTFDQFKLGPGKELWLNRKAKGGRVGFKKGGKGGIGDLMSEMYRLFEIAPLLATPELMDLIQKVPFDKGGKVKKGGGPNMSRRSFLQLMGGLASLPVVGKYFKLGKPVTDFGVKLKTKFHNSDVDYGTSGFAYFDLSSLTGPVKLAASNIIKKLKIKDLKNVEPGDTKLVLKELEKKGIKGKLTGIVDEGGDVLKQAEKAGQKNFVQTYKKQSMKQNVKDHQQYNDYVVYENDPGFRNWNAATKGKLDKPFVSTIDEVAEMLESVVKKAEGGIIEDDEFREFLEDRKNRDKDNFQRDFFEDFKRWKKRKEGNIMEAKDGGRIWRPKSAPKLTTTIPPEKGPTPQGLTYLLGDDIVQNIG